MCFSQKKQKNILKLYNNTNLKNKIIKSKDQLYLSRNNKKIENKSIEKKYDLTLKIKNLHQFDKNLLLNKDIIGFNSSRCAYQNINKILFSLKSNKKVNKSNSVKNIRNINSDNVKKYPLTNKLSKIRNLYLNIKSFNFSRNSSFQLSNNTSKSIDRIKIGNNNSNLNVLIKNKRNNINNFINNEIIKSKTKDKRNNQFNIINELFKKVVNKSKEKDRLLLRLKKIHKSKNKSKKNIKELITSGSINNSFEIKEKENIIISPEEIHFKAIKYYQEIKKLNSN